MIIGLYILGIIIISSVILLVRMNVEKGVEFAKTGEDGKRIALKFEWLYTKSPLRSYYKELKDTIYINELPEETQLSRKAFFIMTKIIMKVIIMAIIYTALAKGVYVLMVIPLSVIVFDSSIVKYLRQNDIQEALLGGVELYKNRYLKLDNCRLALEQTISERSGITRRHLERLHSLIDVPSDEAQKELEIYFAKIPNDQLKLLAMNNHIAYFEGDRKENNESILVKNTQRVINEIRRANIQKNRFFREIQTDNIKMLSPIILLPAIKHFMMQFSSNMPEADVSITVFYNGLYGQLTLAFILLFMLFSYNVHSKFISEKYLVNMPRVKVYRCLLPIVKRFYKIVCK